MKNLRRTLLGMGRVFGFCLPLLVAETVVADDLLQLQEPVLEFSHFLNWLQLVTDEEIIPGGALVIVSAESVQHLQTWGVRSIDRPEPITSDSIFRLASMSKPFAGTAAGILVGHNQQSWETPLAELFPGLKLGTGDSSRSINLRHVVSHSTGLMPHSFSNMLDAGVPFDKIKPKLKEAPTVCAPSKCYGYQNVVFSLIEDVITQATGISYEQFLQEQLFQPLGMLTASVGLEPYTQSPEATSPHQRVRGQWRATSTNPAYYSVAPAAGVNASISDMSKWVQANLGSHPEILSAAALASFQTPIVATPYGNYFNRWSGLEKSYYATGWRVLDYKGMRAIHHGGGVRGYRSEMVFVPALNIGMVLLMNAESSLANDVVPAFLDNLVKSN